MRTKWQQNKTVKIYDRNASVNLLWHAWTHPQQFWGICAFPWLLPWTVCKRTSLLAVRQFALNVLLQFWAHEINTHAQWLVWSRSRFQITRQFNVFFTQASCKCFFAVVRRKWKFVTFFPTDHLQSATELLSADYTAVPLTATDASVGPLVWNFFRALGPGLFVWVSSGGGVKMHPTLCRMLMCRHVWKLSSKSRFLDTGLYFTPHVPFFGSRVYFDHFIMSKELSSGEMGLVLSTAQNTHEPRTRRTRPNSLLTRPFPRPLRRASCTRSRCWASWKPLQTPHHTVL